MYRTELSDAERLQDRGVIAEHYGTHVIFKANELDEGVPTFHAFDSARRERVGCTGLKTLAGDRAQGTRLAVTLPSVHAVAFGKPCSTCWPGGAL